MREVTIDMVDTEWCYPEPLIAVGLLAVDDAKITRLSPEEDEEGVGFDSIDIVYALHLLVGWTLVAIEQPGAHHVELTWTRAVDA